jgi:hypothetical protein
MIKGYIIVHGRSLPHYKILTINTIPTLALFFPIFFPTKYNEHRK